MNRYLKYGLAHGLLILLLSACGSKQNSGPGGQQHGSPSVDEHAGHTKPARDTLHLESRLLPVANIRMEVARMKKLGEQSTFLGTIALNERTVRELTARMPGRIEKLYFRNPGTFIRKGQAVYGLYSESLMSDINDYLVALNQVDTVQQKGFARQLADGAYERLVLGGMREADIHRIRKSRQLPACISYDSPFSGYVSEVLVREGEYVREGSPLLRLADLSTVWVETQVYANEVAQLAQASSVTVELEEFPGEVFPGRVVFSNPALEANRKINLIRIQLDNRSGQLKPGMMAYVSLSRREKEALVIAKTSLLRQAGMTMVWVESEPGLFERRMVKTGLENKKEVEITSGLKTGERVVSTGSYLINSEFILRKGGNKAHTHQ